MTPPQPQGLSPDALRRLVRERLTPALAPDAFTAEIAPYSGDYRLGGPPPGPAAIAAARPAAVLAPIVARQAGLTFLLTQRASHLRAHSGQVAFPGGQIDAGETALAAALREAEEEIGLAARHIEPLGWLDPYLTGTGFRIAPLVALVAPDFTLSINAREVEDAFETPFDFLMDPANHRIDERMWQGRTRKFYAMPHEGRYIWGATAGILRNLYERLFT